MRIWRGSLSDAIAVLVLFVFAFGRGLSLTALAEVDMADPDFRFSSNPAVLLPDHLRDWPPVAPREPREGPRMSTDPTATVSYNAATGGA